jgi:hypothetical protein
VAFLSRKGAARVIKRVLYTSCAHGDDGVTCTIRADLKASLCTGAVATTINAAKAAEAVDLHQRPP